MSSSELISDSTDEVPKGKTIFNPINKLSNLLITGDMSDVKFCVGRQGDIIKAHKFVLSMSSCALRAKFVVPGAEVNENTKKADENEVERVIRIPDIETRTFKALLNYIYTGTLALPPQKMQIEFLMSLMIAAKKYEISELVKDCSRLLNSALSNLPLTMENSITIFRIADLIDTDEELKNDAFNFVLEHFETIITTRAFLSLNWKQLKQFIRNDGIQLLELNIFQCCMSWAAEACKRKKFDSTPTNMRAELKIAFFEIRFTEMFPEDFYEDVLSTNIVTPWECSLIFKYFIAEEKNSLYLPPIPFETRERNIEEESELCWILTKISFKHTHFCQTPNFGFWEHQWIEADASFFIDGFGFSGPLNSNKTSKFIVRIRVQDQKTENTLAYHEDDAVKVRNMEYFFIKFDKSPYLRKNTLYKLSFCLEGPLTKLYSRPYDKKWIQLNDNRDINFKIRNWSRKLVYILFRPGRVLQNDP